MPFLGRMATGVILIALSYTMTAWLLADLGLGFYGVKLVAHRNRPAGEIQAEITKVRLLLSAVIALPLGWVLTSRLHTPLGITLSFIVFLMGRALAGEWRFREEVRFVDLAKVNILASAAQILTVAVFAPPNTWTTTAALPWAVSAIVLFIGAWIRTEMRPQSVWRVPVRTALVHLRSSYAFYINKWAFCVVRTGAYIDFCCFRIRPPSWRNLRCCTA